MPAGGASEGWSAGAGSHACCGVWSGRLLSGESIVELFLKSYDGLPERWRTHIPLRRLLVVDDTATDLPGA